MIDWSRPARAIHNLVRAMQPWPAASTFWQPRLSQSKPPVRLIVHRTEITTGDGTPGEVIEAAGDRLVVAAGEGAVAILSIQLPGKKATRPRRLPAGPSHRARRCSGRRQRLLNRAPV